MRKMSIDVNYPMRSLTMAGKASYIKPYLLRNLQVTRPNQVWSIDIIYASIRWQGHMYIVAIIDVFSQRILSWELSNTLDASESVEFLQQTIAWFGTLENITSYQRSQYMFGLWVEACGNTMKVDSLLDYVREIVLVGINYDKKTKHNTCKIEKIVK